MKTRVVHVSRSLYDVYIGRGPDLKTGVVGKWGNPFVVGRDGNRMECLRKHREWIVQQPELMASLHELRGKILGCWCAPLACHGHTLAELADAGQDALVSSNSGVNIFGEEQQDEN